MQAFDGPRSRANRGQQANCPPGFFPGGNSAWENAGRRDCKGKTTSQQNCKRSIPQSASLTAPASSQAPYPSPPAKGTAEVCTVQSLPCVKGGAPVRTLGRRDCKGKTRSQRNCKRSIPQSASPTAPFTQGSLWPLQPCNISLSWGGFQNSLHLQARPVQRMGLPT